VKVPSEISAELFSRRSSPAVKKRSSDVSSQGVLSSSDDLRFVAVSVAIAVLGSYAALDLAGRITSARRGGALAMGVGIWSMHYDGVLAFRLPVPVEYDWPTVLLSLAVSGIGDGLVRHHTSKNGLVPGYRRQPLHGQRHRRPALHRHGSDVATGNVPLLSKNRSDFL
jgi:Bacterial signalling protein N terminal repeat